MAPARARPIDDTKSETSSTIFNLKEKNTLIAGPSSGVIKPKKNMGPTSIGIMKPVASVNSINTSTAAAAASASAAVVEADSPRINWAKIAPSILHTYRIAYRLPTQPCHTHPHADLIYKSSKTALRAPSAVLARRKLRDLKHQRRKATNPLPPPNYKGKSREKDKDTDTSSNSDRLLKPQSTLQRNTADAVDVPSTSPDPSSTADPPLQPPIIPEYIGKQSPASLATAVRKHFNAQQLNEAEVVARFTYVAKQSRNSRGTVRTEGSTGDGDGWWMGSHGREIRRDDGGEVGFRLRFRP